MKKKQLIILGLMTVIIILFWIFDLFKYISVDRIGDLTDLINSFGLLAPAIFIIIYIIATVFFLPGLPLTLLAGVVFGPIYGTVWVSIASTIGATLAFIISRYIGRDYIVNKFSDSNLFVKLDQGVKDQGWKMVAITRLVPIFPFNAQNYVYGLTDIPLRTYTLVSWMTMLPGTIAYVFLAGAIIGGEGSPIRTISYVGIGAGLLIALSVISKIISKKQDLRNEEKV